jgi:hypothetical protein
MRRYKIGENPEYDQVFSLKEKQSNILNPDPMPNIHIMFSDKYSLERIKAELIGDESGRTIKDGQTILANIPALKKRLSEIDQEFESIKKRAVSSGKDAPEQLPPKEQEEKTLCEALYDIRLTELEYIQNRLDNYVEVEEKTNDADVLRHGPTGSAVLK